MKKSMIMAVTVALALSVVVFGQSCAASMQEQSEELARDFVEKCPTFMFDGMPDTLKLIETEKLDEAAWEFTYEFRCRHGGYGDRTGQMVTQAITPHRAVITVDNYNLTRAVVDGKWNMKTQSMIVTEASSRKTAEEFVKNSPTFKFDGISDSLELVETLYPDIENAWQFVFQFESRHAGYGDRTGEVLAQVITPHEAIITIENGEVKSAIMDGKWDMIGQEML